MALTGKRLLALAAGLALADASVVTLALPRLLTELDATVEGVASVIGVYTVVLALALLPAELLRRRVGSARLGLAGLGLFAAACAGCAAAGSLELLLALRAVQALGGAAALIAAFDLLGAGEPGSDGRRLWTSAAVVGFAAGPALGGVLTQVFDWRAIFVAQVPVALAGMVGCLGRRGKRVAAPGAEAAEAAKPLRRGPAAALGLLSAALTAVLFLLVLLLVAGWNVEPLAAAAAVSVLPLAALATRRAATSDPTTRASAGCALVAAGTLCLAFLPQASLWWTIVPQLLAGAGMGLALPALAGELLPESTPREAGKLLTTRHIGIAVALLVLAPVVAGKLESATERAKERGVAIVLDSKLPPQEKLRLAPDLLAGVDQAEPRRGLERAVDRHRSEYTGDNRSEYERLATRADDTLVEAAAESFRLAFAMTAELALFAALAILPRERRRRLGLARIAAAALAVPLAFVVLHAALAPEPVRIADPCKERELPDAGGLPGFVQDAALGTLDKIACHFGSSREELVLGIADEDEGRRYQRRYGVDPRAIGGLADGFINP